MFDPNELVAKLYVAGMAHGASATTPQNLAFSVCLEITDVGSLYVGGTSLGNASLSPRCGKGDPAQIPRVSSEGTAASFRTVV